MERERDDDDEGSLLQFKHMAVFALRVDSRYSSILGKPISPIAKAVFFGPLAKPIGGSIFIEMLEPGSGGYIIDAEGPRGIWFRVQT